MLMTSSPSNAGSSTCALPPLSPNPRWSKLITPKPASSRSWNDDAVRVRLPPQPWLCSTIGTGFAADADAGLNTVMQMSTGPGSSGSVSGTLGMQTSVVVASDDVAATEGAVAGPASSADASAVAQSRDVARVRGIIWCQRRSTLPGHADTRSGRPFAQVSGLLGSGPTA